MTKPSRRLEPAGPLRPAPVAVTTAARYAGGNILLIEPHKDSRDTYAGYLRLVGGFTVTAVATPDEALVHVERADAVITDMAVLRTDAVAFVSRVRASEPTRLTPIIALAAQRAEADRRELLAAGADAVLPQPCPLPVLASELDLLFSARRIRTLRSPTTP